MRLWKLGKIRYGGTNNAFWKMLNVGTGYGLDFNMKTIFQSVDQISNYNT